MRDLRDPGKLGEMLLRLHAAPSSVYPSHKPLHYTANVAPPHTLNVPDYRDETTLEKYGDPRDLPSTLPN